jgi:hypothetical protein
MQCCTALGAIHPHTHRHRYGHGHRHRDRDPNIAIPYDPEAAGNPKPATSLLWHDDTPVDISERSYGEHDNLPALVRTVMRVSVMSESSDAARFIGKPPPSKPSFPLRSTPCNPRS